MNVSLNSVRNCWMAPSGDCKNNRAMKRRGIFQLGSCSVRW